jgi:3-oxoacyl-ACP reductase-like protein
MKPQPLGRIRFKENKKSKIETEDRVALVTGSTSGIGMEIAKRLFEEGFTVAFHFKSSVFRLV